MPPSVMRACRLRASIGALVVMLGVLLLGAPVEARADAAGPPDDFGLNVQSLLRGSFYPSTWDGFLSTMADDGVGTARLDAVWRWAETTPPVDGVHTFDWTRQDRLVT